jgi:hypothetical protein
VEAVHLTIMCASCFFSGRYYMTSQEVVDFVREQLGSVSFSLIFSVCYAYIVIHENKFPTE